MIRGVSITYFAGYVSLLLSFILLDQGSIANDGTFISTLLTDPFLQIPTADGVHVVWFSRQDILINDVRPLFECT